MKNLKKRAGAWLLASLLFVMAAFFAGCDNGQTESVENGISVTVKITNAEPTVVLEETVTIAQDQANAGQAVKTACQSKNFAFTESNGMYDGFGGEMSTETDGWLLYINGEQAQVGANDSAVVEGDVVEFRYENYDEAFAQ